MTAPLLNVRSAPESLIGSIILGLLFGTLVNTLKCHTTKQIDLRKLV